MTSLNNLRYHQMLVSPHVGGGARVAMGIHAYATATRGPVSGLVLPTGGEAERLARACGATFADYRPERLLSRSFVRAGLENLSLLRKLLPHGVGVIHIHSPFVYGAARPFLTMSGLKSVLHVHADLSAEQLKWPLQRPPHLIVLCAKFIQPEVEKALPPAAVRHTTIRVLQNAVDTERFFPGDRAAAKEQIGVPKHVPLLLMAANLAPGKGQETAIRCVAALRALGQYVRLWLVGEEHADCPGFGDRLSDLVRELNLREQVSLVGFRRDVPDLMRAADFLLLPSSTEGMPLVVLEGQASKAIVLAAPTGGTPELIADGRTGYLIGAQDHVGYAHRILHLITNPHEAQAVVEAAYRETRERHDLRRYCSRLLEEYDRLLEDTR